MSKVELLYSRTQQFLAV